MADLSDSQRLECCRMGCNGTFSAMQHVMEQETNRFGEDYKDLDRDTPEPVLCVVFVFDGEKATNVDLIDCH